MKESEKRKRENTIPREKKKKIGMQREEKVRENIMLREKEKKECL